MNKKPKKLNAARILNKRWNKVFSGPIPLPKIARSRYTNQDTPDFKDGDIVEVDLSFFGIHRKEDKKRTQQYIIEGVIVGRWKSDDQCYWVIDVGDKTILSDHKFRTILVTHHSLIKDEPLAWENV